MNGVLGFTDSCLFSSGFYLWIAGGKKYHSNNIFDKISCYQ